jgi:hypothetical protein
MHSLTQRGLSNLSETVGEVAIYATQLAKGPLYEWFKEGFSRSTARGAVVAALIEEAGSHAH